MFQVGDRVRVIFTNKTSRFGYIDRIDEKGSHPYVCRLEKSDQLVYCRECDLEKAEEYGKDKKD